MTEAGRFILFPFKVILTSFQSNSIPSYSTFLFNLTSSGVNIPVILNECLLITPTTLICCEARMDSKDCNFVPLHIIYKTIDVTTNKIIAVTN